MSLEELSKLVEDGEAEEAQALAKKLKAASWHLGLGGRMDNAVLSAVINSNPKLYSRDSLDHQELEQRLHSLTNVANWLASGGRTAFLQDANTPIMRTPELVEVIRYLKESLPSIERVTSYARAKTLAKRSLGELKDLYQAGLSRHGEKD